MVVAVGVLEKDEVRLLGQVEAAVAQFQAGGDVQAIGKNRSPVGPAIAVGILEDQHLVVDRLAGEIHRKGAHRGHPQTAPAVEGDRHRIAQLRKLDLRGEQIDCVTVGQLERLQLFGGGQNVGFLGRDDRFDLGQLAGVAESSITAGTGLPWATAQMRRSRLATIRRSLANSGGKFTALKAFFRSP